MDHHDSLMRHAIELAWQGRWSTSPNPRVGCVIVRDGRILGEGWHRRAGDRHAEIVALEACSQSAAGATVYVNLEPCSHTGRTAPCADALINAGVARVVVATEDPNPIVAGEGIRRLREAGIDVIVGASASEAERLNESYLHAMRTGLPYVILKAGLTLDGKIATVARESQWITSEESRFRSLELREEADAILVGAGTITADDPQLTRRIGRNDSAQKWLRVVLDSPEGIPSSARVLNDGNPTLLFTSRHHPAASGDAVDVVELPGDDELDLRSVLAELHRRHVRSVIVEGGARVHASFLEQRLWQRMELFIAPMIVGGAEAPSMYPLRGIPQLGDAIPVRFDVVEHMGRDIHVIARQLDAD